MSIKHRISGAAGSVALALCAFSTGAIAQDLDFKLINKTRFAVVEFYASPADVGEWEDDILGLQILDPKSVTNITIGDGREQCEYDLRFVFDDGDVIEKAAVNLCETGSYTLTE